MQAETEKSSRLEVALAKAEVFALQVWPRPACTLGYLPHEEAGSHWYGALGMHLHEL